MLRDSRVSEHLETKSIVDLTSSLRHAIVTLVKWRPPGRPSNRRTAGRISPMALSSREPVSFGEVEGVFHTSLPRWGRINARSSRRGKEQMRSKTSREIALRLSDLRVGDSPWNGVRVTCRSTAVQSKRMYMRLRKVRIQSLVSASSAVVTERPQMERLRVW
jgi:hypothetical protein